MIANHANQRYDWLVDTLLIASSVVLAAGLVTHLVFSNEPLAHAILGLGLVLLMATPALRIMIALGQRFRQRDLQFIAITLIVLFELSLTLWYATTRV